MAYKFPPLWRKLVILLILLASCTTTTAEPAAIVESTAVNVPVIETLSPLPTFTPYPLGSPVPFPTQQQNLPFPTATLTLTPLPAVLPKFPLDGYVMLFSKDDDLYFQDGENAPVKLTHIGEKGPSLPEYISLLSDDNQKVVFIRRDDSNIYSINTDGTQENIAISNDKMNSFGLEMKIGALRFVPNTHQLFFVAIQCKAQDNSPCPTSAFLANTDTGKITKLADLGLLLTNPGFGEADLSSLFVNPYFGEYRNIKISPDGKMLAVGTPEGMDIFTLDGNLIRDNALPFTPSTGTVSVDYPSLFWLPDSSGLIAALPDSFINIYALNGRTRTYTIWRYSLNDNSAVQISFDPPVIRDMYEVSPDGNWIAYYGGIPESPYYLYLGDLKNGTTKFLGNIMMNLGFSWSLNSEHLIVGGALLSPDGRFVLQESADSWVDAVHFRSFRRNLIAEIIDNEVRYYELEFPFSTFRLK